MQGKYPAAKVKKEFLELLNKLYDIHAAFKRCISYYPIATETCKKIEDFILELQRAVTFPKPLK